MVRGWSLNPVWLVALSACTSSTQTSDIGATFEATDQDGKLSLALQLVDYSGLEADPPPYILSASEGVRATFRDKTVALVQGDTQVGDYGYYADVVVDSEVAGDEPITVTLDRGDDGRVSFEVTAPPEFALAAMASTPQPVDVNWSPVEQDPMRWSATTWCGQNELDTDGPIPQDAGSIEFPKGVLATAPLTSSCSSTIEFTRWRGSWPENALHVCSAYFNRIHDVAVEITP